MRAFDNNIRRVTPYVPGEQPQTADKIKLNTNENPYPPAPGVARAIRELDHDTFRLYPDPSAKLLIDALSSYYQVGSDQVFVGIGSDDVLAMCFLTFFNSEKPLLFPNITYSFYKVWAELYKIPYETPELKPDFRLESADYYRPNGGVIFPNPNAPTSRYEELDTVRDILDHNADSIVIVDEAYIDFAGPSAIKLLPEYENLLVVQTFSKARSMAGMRIGYCIGSPYLIACLNSVKYSFNSYTLNWPAIYYGTEAVKDVAYFNETIGKIKATRSRSAEIFRELGFVFTEPAGNFLFVTHPDYHAVDIFRYLREHSIFVRHFDTPELNEYLRITVGTDEQMDRLFDCIRDFQKLHHNK